MDHFSDTLSKAVSCGGRRCTAPPSPLEIVAESKFRNLLLRNDAFYRYTDSMEIDDLGDVQF